VNKVIVFILPVILLISAGCENSSYPFEDVTDPFTFTYVLSQGGSVDLIVLNCYMNNIKTLMSDSTQTAGTYTSSWDLLDESATRVQDGLYYIRIVLDDSVIETKMYEVHK